MTYAVSYSFSAFQAGQPDKPLPASFLDAEFAALQAWSDAVTADLADLRRSDGALKNGVVGFDALDPQVQALLGGTARTTVPDLDPTAFASQAEAEAGAATDKLMTPAAATFHVDAKRPFSSQAQAQAGTNAVSVLSPARGKDMLDALRGFASQAQAEAGTNEATVLSPLRGAQQIAALRSARSASAALTFGLIGAGASATQTITVAGAAVNDRVVVGLPAAGVDAGLLVTAWVSASNTVTVRLTNVTAGGITPAAAATWAVTALRF